MPKTAILIPAYKRPEYTDRLLQSILEAQKYKDVVFYLVDDGSGDNTQDIFHRFDIPSIIVVHDENRGLRNTIMYFFKEVKNKDFDFIGKIDNDVTVPANWLDSILNVFDSSDVDILSPNVFPSNAAFKIGDDPEPGGLYRPSEYVGGLWFMKKRLIENMEFEKHDIIGITGAFSLLDQIIIEQEPKVGWLGSVTFQDMGHWSGRHPGHIKTGEHALYYQEVGRKVTW